MAISERSTEILRKLVFLNMFVKGKPYIKLGFVKTSPFDPTSKKCQILTKNVFLPKVKPHTAKLCYSVFFEAFSGKLTENFSFY